MNAEMAPEIISAAAAVSPKSLVDKIPGITGKSLSFKSTRLTGTLACCSHTAWFSMTSMMSLAQVAKRGATSGLRQQVVSRGEWISKDSCLISDTS